MNNQHPNKRTNKPQVVTSQHATASKHNNNNNNAHEQYATYKNNQQ